MKIPSEVTPYLGVAIIAIVASYYFFVKVLPRLQGRADLLRDEQEDEEEEDDNDDDDEDEDEDDDDDDGQIYYNDEGTLSDAQYKKLSLGAIYSEQQEAWINTVATGLTKKQIRQIVGRWWGILCPDDAVAKLDYLRDKGFRYYFPTVLRAVTQPAAEREAIILEAFPGNEEDQAKALSQVENLLETMQDLEDDGVIDSSADIVKYGVDAWDCGRLVFVARLCHDIGYISEKQVWSYIDAAAELARHSFNSWQAYAKSYVIGRCLWAGSEEDSTIPEIAEYLLENEESPWVKLPW
jgi:hypothetical protein